MSCIILENDAYIDRYQRYTGCRVSQYLSLQLGVPVAEPINRTQLLRGDLRGDHVQIRPPWSKPEEIFLEQCARCDDCITKCQQKIIQRGRGGFPQIDFKRGFCTFCGDCVKVCGYGALAFSSNLEQLPWSLSIKIKDDCLAKNGVVCRICGERCEESAIHFQLQTGGRAKPTINLELCSGCGECFSVCPSQSVNIQPQSSEKAA